MFNFLKSDPKKKLTKKRDALLLEARNLQRGGDIKGYAAKMDEVQELEKKIAES